MELSRKEADVLAMLGLQAGALGLVRVNSASTEGSLGGHALDMFVDGATVPRDGGADSPVTKQLRAQLREREAVADAVHRQAKLMPRLAEPSLHEGDETVSWNSVAVPPFPSPPPHPARTTLPSFWPSSGPSEHCCGETRASRQATRRRSRMTSPTSSERALACRRVGERRSTSRCRSQQAASAADWTSTPSSKRSTGDARDSSSSSSSSSSCKRPPPRCPVRASGPLSRLARGAPCPRPRRNPRASRRRRTRMRIHTCPRTNRARGRGGGGPSRGKAVLPLTRLRPTDLTPPPLPRLPLGVAV